MKIIKSLLIATGILALYLLCILGICLISKIIGVWTFAILAVIFIVVIAVGINLQ